MHACIIEADIKTGGYLELTDLPFSTSDHVEIIIVKKNVEMKKNVYSLRGKSVHYENPFESVAESDWELLNDND